MLKNNELVLCVGVNQLRTPNIAMIAAACGFDAVYIDPELWAGRADVKQMRELKLA
jgi:hypothetical protein